MRIDPADRSSTDKAIIQRNLQQTLRPRSPLDEEASDADRDKAPDDTTDAEYRSRWVAAFEKAITSHNHLWMNKLAKTADDKGKKIEHSVRAERAKHWRQIIGGRIHDQPTKIAYRWIKGGAAPQTSPLVTADANDDVPEVDTATTCPKVIQYQGSHAKIPAAQQTMVDNEAEKWAKLW